MPKIIIMCAADGNTYEIETENCTAITNSGSNWSGISLSVWRDPSSASSAHARLFKEDGTRILGRHMPSAEQRLVPSSEITQLLASAGNRVGYVSETNGLTHTLQGGPFNASMISNHHKRFLATLTPANIEAIHNGAFLRQDLASPQTVQGYQWSIAHGSWSDAKPVQA